ncbi:MAG: hypothetical protein JNM66_08350 [Bryobacterales bacterium]|nr:hypothetical protein [Bryobacterales bacterium]
MPCLTLLTTASIQEFIFRSNRLRENLGASELVRDSMRYWSDHPETLFVGGGNAALVFPSLEDARRAVSAWSTAMLRCAPGLRLVAAHEPFQNGSLAAAFTVAQQHLFEAENLPPLGSELGALPVVRACPSTALAASELAAPIKDPAPLPDDVEDTEDEQASPVWLSADAHAKRDYYWRNTRRRLAKDYGRILRADKQSYLFPRDFDLLGTVEGASQAALIHADGNGIGMAFQRLFDRFKDGGRDEDLISELRSLSHRLDTGCANAFRKLLRELIDELPAFESSGAARLARRHGKLYLPIRPIVDDGDDLTFICHGRLGLYLAKRYLELFQMEFAATGDKFTASAGVLIMPKKFPFAQAYSLAAGLCSSAKKAARKQECPDSWLDFHILLEGRAGDITTIRESYPEGIRRLPYSIAGKSVPWRTLEKLVEEAYRQPRSKVKYLRWCYASGAVQADIDKSKARGNDIFAAGHSRLQQFDALELIDFYYTPARLKKLEQAHATTPH